MVTLVFASSVGGLLSALLIIFFVAVAVSIFRLPSFGRSWVHE